MLIMSIRRLCRCIEMDWFIDDFISFGLDNQYNIKPVQLGGVLILIFLAFFCYTVDMTLNPLDIMSMNE